MPQIEARLGAPGPEGTTLGSEIAHQFDEQTFVKVTRHLLQESVLADQIAYVVIGFATAVGAQLLATWLYDKMKARKGAWLEIDGERIPLDKDEIRRILANKLTASE